VLAFACALAASQEEDFSKVHMKVTKVAGNVYMRVRRCRAARRFNQVQLQATGGILRCEEF